MMFYQHSLWFWLLCFFVSSHAFAMAQRPIGQSQQTVKVDHVVDGDTIVLEDGRKVRLIGINAPEMDHHDAKVAQLARNARDFLIDQVEKQRVVLVEDEDKYDRYDRTLAYLELEDGRDVQAMLLKQGLAVAVVFPPNVARIKQYANAERSAYQRGLGVWQTPALWQDFIAKPRIRAKDGFALVKVRLERIKQSRSYVILTTDKKFAILIPRRSYEEYWHDEMIEQWLGKVVITRGWINRNKHGPYVVVKHPALIIENEA